MSEIFIQKQGSLKDGNYWGALLKRESIDHEKKFIVIDVRLEHRDSSGDAILDESGRKVGKIKSFRFGETQYNNYIAASKAGRVAMISNFLENKINPST